MAPHQSLDYSLHYYFEGTAYWTWTSVFDDATQQYTLEASPTQSLLVFAAPDTGHATFNEVDSQGHIIPGNPDVTFASGIDFSAACFAAGTRILTSHGEVIIEAVQAGDRVTTVLGRELRPARRVAHRHVDLRGHRRPWDVMPVRIAAHAFGPGPPHRAPLLSPVLRGVRGRRADPGAPSGQRRLDRAGGDEFSHLLARRTRAPRGAACRRPAVRELSGYRQPRRLRRRQRPGHGAVRPRRLSTRAERRAIAS